MTVLASIIGVLLVLLVLSDTFETIVLPRSVTRRWRLTKLFYLVTWRFWSNLAQSVHSAKRRDSILSFYGPLSLILLLALWATGLMLGFALVQWGWGVPLTALDDHPGLGTYIYMSGVTLFTLGFGDVTPHDSAGRIVSVVEAGVGIGFLAMVIGYLPVIYQAFSRREVGISLLDSRAGSPPTAGELLKRHAEADCMNLLPDLLKEWERWSADMLESHLSYPVLVFYRSQHDRESWLAALTAIIDTSALLEYCGPTDADWCNSVRWQARLTFAMARHALIDLALIINKPPEANPVDRLPAHEWERLRDSLCGAGITLEPGAEAALTETRRQYEPYVEALAGRLMLELPPWLPEGMSADNWETSAWDNAHHF